MKLLHRNSVTAAMLLAALALLQSSSTADARNISCDGADSLTASCNLNGSEADLSERLGCTENEIAARLVGCFVCADIHTCLPTPPRDTHSKPANAEAKAEAKATPLKVTSAKVKIHSAAAASVHLASPSKDYVGVKTEKAKKGEKQTPTASAADADTNDEIAQLSLPFIPDALSVAESAQFNGADVSSSPETVAGWPVMAPAILALVSIGVALRSRARHKRGEKFERVADCERDDEINPFCNDGVQNPQDDDVAGGVEFAARFTVASDDDDSGREEAAHAQDAADEGGELAEEVITDSRVRRSKSALRMKQRKSIVSGISAVSHFAIAPSPSPSPSPSSAVTSLKMASSASSYSLGSDNNAGAPATWVNIPFNVLTIRENIGGGGVALVHRGVYLQQPVAVKMLFDPRVDEELKQEFMDELLVMSKLRHTNVVQLIGACTQPPNLCMVMELCEGSLHQALHATNRFFSVPHLTRIALDVASGMQYLHSRSPAVIHRDLKSHNVLLDSTGTAKLCDFGLVCTKFTTAGTPSYMPPELLSGKPFSKAVDVFMFGVLLWEIFTREVPFQGYDVADIRRKVLAGERFRVPTLDCPEPCQALMRRCWDGEPTQRPTFDEVREVLCGVADSLQHSGSSHLQSPSYCGVARGVDACFEGDALDGLLRGR